MSDLKAVFGLFYLKHYDRRNVVYRTFSLQKPMREYIIATQTPAKGHYLN